VLDAEKWQAQAGLTEESCMTGDVNLFLTDLDDPTLGEIEVMIAGLFHLAQAPPPTITLVCGRLRVGEPVPGWGKLPCDYSQLGCLHLDLSLTLWYELNLDLFFVCFVLVLMVVLRIELRTLCHSASPFCIGY
jgi:hypothetical protein